MFFRAACELFRPLEQTNVLCSSKFCLAYCYTSSIF